MSFKAQRDGVCIKCNGPITKLVSDITWAKTGTHVGIPFHIVCENAAAVPASVATSQNGGTIGADLVAAFTRLVENTQAPAVLDTNAVISLIDERLKDITIPRVLEIKNDNKPPVKLDRVHSQFETLLKLAGTRDHNGNRLNIYLYGESGSGKSHGADQLTQALTLGYDFCSLEPQAPLSLIRGYMNAAGDYVPSGFFTKYTQGGGFCFDELDNSSSTFQTCLNSALSNGYASFPHGRFKRHPDFICIATGNTIGLGPTTRYPSRRAMDPATRDRFEFLQWENDNALTRSIVSGIIGPDKTQDLIDWVDREGSALVASHPTCFITPRSYIKSALLESQGMTRDQVREMVIRRGVK